MFELVFTASARKELDDLEAMSRHEGLVKQIKKSLGYLQHNLNLLVLRPREETNHDHCDYLAPLNFLMTLASLLLAADEPDEQM